MTARWGAAGFLFGVLSLLASTPQAEELEIVEVDSREAACVFDPGCHITLRPGLDDTCGEFGLSCADFPHCGVVCESGAVPGCLQSRTFVGDRRSAAAGLHGYRYRVFVGPRPPPPGRPVQQGGEKCCGPEHCIVIAEIPFRGLVRTLDYDGDGAADDGYVITSGALGGIDFMSADLTGDLLTLTFETEACGDCFSAASTFFIGFASFGPPQSETANLAGPIGDPHAKVVDVRVPQPGPYLRESIIDLPVDAIGGRHIGGREGLRHAMLNRADAAAELAARGLFAPAVRVLRNLQSKMDGRRDDWVVDAPSTSVDERAALFDMVQEVTDRLASHGR